jgi:hypothetical protein
MKIFLVSCTFALKCNTINHLPIKLDHFLGVQGDFVQQILYQFGMRLVPTAIACFFSENNFGVKLRTLRTAAFALKSLPQQFWLESATPLATRSTMPSDGNNSKYLEHFHREYKRYMKILENLQLGEYAALLTTELKLTEVGTSSNIYLFTYANLPIPIPAMQFD